MIEGGIVYGLVSESKPGFAKVKLPTFDDIVTDWLPIIKTRAMNDDENWPLEINEQVACWVDCYCKRGIVLGAISSDADTPDGDAVVGKYRKKFSDGTYLEYDKGSHTLTASVPEAGTVNIVQGAGQLSLKENKLSYKNSDAEVDLKSIMTDILTHAQNITVIAAGMTSTFPLNATDFANDLLNINKLLF